MSDSTFMHDVKSIRGTEIVEQIDPNTFVRNIVIDQGDHQLYIHVFSDVRESLIIEGNNKGAESKKIITDLTDDLAKLGIEHADTLTRERGLANYLKDMTEACEDANDLAYDRRLEIDRLNEKVTDLQADLDDEHSRRVTEESANNTLVAERDEAIKKAEDAYKSYDITNDLAYDRRLEIDRLNEKVTDLQARLDIQNQPPCPAYPDTIAHWIKNFSDERELCRKLEQTIIGLKGNAKQASNHTRTATILLDEDE